MDKIVELCQLKRIQLGQHGSVSLSDVNLAESRLGKTLPPSYKNWLLNYASAKIFGSEVYSVAPKEFCEDADTDIATAHQTNMQQGLTPANHIYIFEPDWNEYFFFDCELEDARGEWPVFVKNAETGDIIKFADDFNDFIVKLINMVSSS